MSEYSQLDRGSQNTFKLHDYDIPWPCKMVPDLYKYHVTPFQLRKCVHSLIDLRRWSDKIFLHVGDYIKNRNFSCYNLLFGRGESLMHVGFTVL